MKRENITLRVFTAHYYNAVRANNAGEVQSSSSSSSSPLSFQLQGAKKSERVYTATDTQLAEEGTLIKP